MPHVARLCHGSGEKVSAISSIVHLSSLISYKCTNACNKVRLEGLVLVRHDNRVVRRVRTATYTFIMTHPDPPNKEIYATQRLVQIVE